MSQPRHEPMTPEQFLAWEARQDLKWEFDGFQPVAMTGGTFGHSRIQGNLIAALIARLRGRPCQPCGPDVRVQVHYLHHGRGLCAVAVQGGDGERIRRRRRRPVHGQHGGRGQDGNRRHHR